MLQVYYLMASECMPNSGLPMRCFEKTHIDSPKKHKFEQNPR